MSKEGDRDNIVGFPSLGKSKQKIFRKMGQPVPESLSLAIQYLETAKKDFNNGQYNLAAEYAFAAIAKEPLMDEAIALIEEIGQKFLEKKYFAQAVNHYSNFSRVCPNRVEAFTGLGTAYLNYNMPKEADDVFEQALKLDPHNPEALFFLGMIAYFDNKAEKAKAYLSRLLELSNLSIEKDAKKQALAVLKELNSRQAD